MSASGQTTATDSGPSSEPVVVLGRSGVRRLADGHPWLFADHIVHGSERDGELVRLEGPAGTPRGAAVLNCGSRIPLRVVSRDAARQPSPTWWRERLDEAVQRRASSLAPGQAACRWVHAEADGLPGLVIDRYADVAVLQAGCRWADGMAEPIARHLVGAHGMRGVLARHDGGFRRHEGLADEVRLLAGEVPATVAWHHEGPAGQVVRQVDPWRGQKTGTYLDQRENQPWAADVLRAASVPEGRCLDAFCHDGGFALHLAAAGAEVDALDSSRPALDRLRETAAANGLGDRIHEHSVNVFEHLRELAAGGASYAGIVLDPPALAKRRQDVRSALRAYKELALRALRLLQPGGRLVSCSCSFHVGREDFLGALRSAAADVRREVVVRALRGAAACHPRLLTFPESDYLKVVLLEVR